MASRTGQQWLHTAVRIFSLINQRPAGCAHPASISYLPSSTVAMCSTFYKHRDECRTFNEI